MHFYSLVEKSQDQPEEYFPWFVQNEKVKQEIYYFYFYHAPIIG